MTIILDLPPELEQELERKAERLGIATSDYVRELVAQELGNGEPIEACESLMTPFEEWERAVDQWRAGHWNLDAPEIPAEALRRESLCDDRGI